MNTFDAASLPKPSCLALAPSFGFGDRLGLATPGHQQALEQAGQGIRGIFAQQSIREMSRTQRTPEQVMTAAAKNLAGVGYDDPWGADADHLKTQADVDATLAAGFTFFTIDPSDFVDPQADRYAPGELAEQFKVAQAHVDWVDQYVGQTIKIKGGGSIKFDEKNVRRAAVKYGRAIAHASKLGSYIALASAKLGSDFEIELSVDETPEPTTPAEHYIIADQCLKSGMKLVSLAPRFVGEFEKGVDYKGDLAQLEKSLKVHAAIARQLGPYKLSLHSGSDKLSIYALLAKTTRGMFHVKTAGTSYLEALRAVARHDRGLFRRIVEFARQRYDQDKATYHVSATVAGCPSPSDVPDDRELERLYLGLWSETPEGVGFTQPGRQILHCTFGSVLTDSQLGPELKSAVQTHQATYTEVLVEHFVKHLQPLAQEL